MFVVQVWLSVCVCVCVVHIHMLEGVVPGVVWYRSTIYTYMCTTLDLALHDIFFVKNYAHPAANYIRFW